MPAGHIQAAAPALGPPEQQHRRTSRCEPWEPRTRLVLQGVRRQLGRRLQAPHRGGVLFQRARHVGLVAGDGLRLLGGRLPLLLQQALQAP